VPISRRVGLSLIGKDLGCWDEDVVLRSSPELRHGVTEVRHESTQSWDSGQDLMTPHPENLTRGLGKSCQRAVDVFGPITDKHL